MEEIVGYISFKIYTLGFCCVVISIVKIIFNLLINNIMNKLKEKALRLGATDLKKSTRKNKRLMVKYNNKWIHLAILVK